MKYLISAVAMLLTAAALCVVNIVCIDRVANQTGALLTEASDRAAAGDWDGAGRLCAEAQNYWLDQKTYIGTVLRHSESDEVSTRLEPLIKYAQKQADAEFSALCAELTAQLNHIKDMERPTLGNLF